MTSFFPCPCPYFQSNYSTLPTMQLPRNISPLITSNSLQYSVNLSQPTLNMQVETIEQRQIICPNNLSIDSPKEAPLQNPSENKQTNAVRKQFPREENKGVDEDSLSSIPTNLIKKLKFSVSGYRSRNVFKSILRHMCTLVRTQRTDMVELLKQAGYTKVRIEHVFFKISQYKDIERDPENKKTYLLVCKMIAKKSIYTYILKETLCDMIKKWDSGSQGRIASSNLHIYQELCNAYYNEAIKTLGEPMQVFMS